MTAVPLVNVIADVAVIVYAPALPVPVADLSDLLALIVQGDPPDLFMPESELPARRGDMDGHKVDHTVCKFRSVMSE